MGGLSPTIAYFRDSRLRSTTFSRSNCWCSRARFMVRSMVSGDLAFSMKWYAPSFVDSNAISMLPCPDIIITGTSGCVSFTFLRTSKPLMSGSIRSSSIRSTPSAWTIPKASSPLLAVMVSYPSSSSTPDRELRISFSSSTIKIVWLINILHAQGAVFRLITGIIPLLLSQVYSFSTPGARTSCPHYDTVGEFVTVSTRSKKSRRVWFFE